MHFSYGFDIGVQDITVPDLNFMAELHTSELPGRLNGEPEMRRAMAEPVGSPRLRACAQSGSRVVIVSSLEKGDTILPSVMPAILDELYTGGVRRKDITLLLPYDFSVNSEDKLEALVGERTIREIAVRTIDFNETVVIDIGEDIPEIRMNRAAAEADLRVLIGNTGYHHFLGYSGGSETLVSTCCPIPARNALLAAGEVRPVSSYSEITVQKERFDAVAQAVGANFSIDMIRGTDGSIKSVCAGDVIEAHREGTRYLNAMCLKKLPCPADIVVVSAGGSPLDNDLLHALPALDHAHAAVCEGGSIIFIASCKNGFGSKEFERILLDARHEADFVSPPNDVDSDIREACSIIALTQKNNTVWFVSDQEDPLFDKIFPYRKSNAQAALNVALGEAGRNALVLSMPYGIHTVPVLPGNS